MEEREDKGGARLLSFTRAMYLVAFGMAVYHLYRAYFGVYEIMQHRGIHLLFVLILSFMNRGLCKPGRSRLLKAYDLVLIGLTLAIGYNLVFDYEEIAMRAGSPEWIDKVSLPILYLFIYDQSLFLIGPVTRIVPTLFFVLLGVYGLAASLQGYMLGPLSLIGRLTVFSSSCLLLWPNNRYADLAGLALFAVYYFLHRKKRGEIQP